MVYLRIKLTKGEVAKGIPNWQLYMIFNDFGATSVRIILIISFEMGGLTNCGYQHLAGILDCTKRKGELSISIHCYLLLDNESNVATYPKPATQ